MKKLFRINLLVLISLLFTRCAIPDKPKEVRPNILFFLVDDQRNDMLSVAGHPIVQTPTVDKLAKKGVRFTNAFVTTPICAASRASILTGLYEATHNFTFKTPPIKTEFTTNTYPYLLKQSGYHTGFVGKFGVEIEHQDSIISHLFDYYRPSPVNMPHFDTLADGSIRHSAEVKGDQAVEYLKAQSPDQPFCLSISFNAVHAAKNKITGIEGDYPYPKAVAHLYEGVEMPQPDLSNPEIYANHPDFLKKSLNRERFFWRWDTEEKYQTNMRAYYRMISGYDKVMQRVIAALEEQGLAENTIIIYAADNGYYMGNRGFAGKWSHYEESLRVPLVIYDPRRPKAAERISDRLALNIDIPATILNYAGLSVPSLYQGESLVPIVNNEPINEWRSSFFHEHRFDHPKIPKYRGIRGERYVYANYYEQNPPYEYLHDLEKDPNQLENLVTNPDYFDVLQDLRRTCDSVDNKLIKN